METAVATKYDQESVFNLILHEDEVSWQTIIFELVKKEEIDPWDVDISILSKKFISMLKTLKKMDFRISGKVIFAAALLLRLKSSKFLDQDITNLNRLISSTEAEADDGFFDELFDGENDISPELRREARETMLYPRTPQPRKRKVSVFDLVEALQKALEVKKRRVSFHGDRTETTYERKTRDITEIIEEVYEQLKIHLEENKTDEMMFSELTPSSERKDLVYTFMPLLHLDFQARVLLTQKEHLGDFSINLIK